MEPVPWICPQCGEPNDGETCAKCGAIAPLAEAGGNEPGSYLATVHGRGCYNAPRWLVLLVLAEIAAFVVWAAITVATDIWSARR